MSPEALIDHIYGPKTDVWAFGVFMYEILHGDTPLGFCQSEPELRMHVRTPIRPEAINARVSYELKDLIFRCLDVDERRRISIQEIDQMPFMRRLSAQYSYQNQQPPPQQLNIANMHRPLTPNSYARGPESARMKLLEPPVARNQQQYSTSPDRGNTAKRNQMDGTSQFQKNKSFENLQPQQHFRSISSQEAPRELPQPRFGVEE